MKAIWPATLILLLGAALRLWQITALPPGLHHDEAFHGLTARSVLAGDLQPYFVANNGNEPAYIYLLAGGIALWGPHPWVGRLTAAFVGLLGVALMVPLGRAFAPATVDRDRWGLAAALALTGLYLHLNFSRFGSQPILAPVAGAGAMWGWWAGVKTGRRRYFVMCGAFTGLGLASYVAFRLFPLALVIAALLHGLLRQHARRALGGLFVAGMTATAIYAPLGVWFLQHPGWFFNRYNQVVELRHFWANASRALGGLFLQGDGDWKYNLPGRPALDWVQTGLFALGSVWSVRGMRRAETPTLWLWLTVGLLPSALTELAPQFGRSVGAAPALALFVAGGLVELAKALRRQRAQWGWAFVLLVGLAPVTITARDYFVRWGRDHNLYMAFDVGIYQLARQIAEVDGLIYLSPLYAEYPTLRYVLAADSARVQSYNGRACDVWLASGEQATYAVITPEDPQTLPGLIAVFPSGHAGPPVYRGEFPYVEFWQVPASAEGHWPSMAAIDVNVGDFAKLMGYNLAIAGADGGSAANGSGAFGPNRVLTVDLYWQTLAPTDGAYTVFVHLLQANAGSATWVAGDDRQPCDNSRPTLRWRPGEVLHDVVRVHTPAELAAGRFQLTVGMYDPRTGARLPVGGRESTIAPNSIVLEEFE